LKINEPGKKSVLFGLRAPQQLTVSRVEWTNRRGSGQGSTAADAAMAGVIARLEAEIAALDQAIVHVIGQDEVPGTIC